MNIYRVRSSHFLASVAHEMFDRVSHFVHVEVRRPASAPVISRASKRMEGGAWGCACVGSCECPGGCE